MSLFGPCKILLFHHFNGMSVIVAKWWIFIIASLQELLLKYWNMLSWWSSSHKFLGICNSATVDGRCCENYLLNTHYWIDLNMDISGYCFDILVSKVSRLELAFIWTIFALFYCNVRVLYLFAYALIVYRNVSIVRRNLIEKRRLENIYFVGTSLHCIT